MPSSETRSLQVPQTPWSVVVSRSHASPVVREFSCLLRCEQYQFISIGSLLTVLERRGASLLHGRTVSLEQSDFVVGVANGAEERESFVIIHLVDLEGVLLDAIVFPSAHPSRRAEGDGCFHSNSREGFDESQQEFKAQSTKVPTASSSPGRSLPSSHFPRSVLAKSVPGSLVLLHAPTVVAADVSADTRVRGIRETLSATERICDSASGHVSRSGSVYIKGRVSSANTAISANDLLASNDLGSLRAPFDLPPNRPSRLKLFSDKQAERVGYPPLVLYADSAESIISLGPCEQFGYCKTTDYPGNRCMTPINIQKAYFCNKHVNMLTESARTSARLVHLPDSAAASAAVRRQQDLSKGFPTSVVVDLHAQMTFTRQPRDSVADSAKQVSAFVSPPASPRVGPLKIQLSHPQNPGRPGAPHFSFPTRRVFKCVQCLCINEERSVICDSQRHTQIPVIVRLGKYSCPRCGFKLESIRKSMQGSPCPACNKAVLQKRRENSGA